MRLRAKTKPQEFEHEVDCGSIILPIKIKISKRKSLAIQINSATEIIVRAPLKFSVKKIENFVQEKQDWILLHQKKLGQKTNLSAPKKYIDDEAFMFLGKKYQLKIRQALANKVELIGSRFLLHSTHPKNKNKNKKLIDDWYKNQAEKIFNERLIECKKTAEKIDIEVDNKIKLRRMKSRWGSCSIDSEITLNIHLVCAEETCIDYVILHELCHIREHNHSKRFYALMDIVMPDWKQVKKQLNNSVTI